MAFKLTPPPPAAVKRHGKVHHLHGGVKFLAKTVWTQHRVNNKLRLVSIGRLCAYCDFILAEVSQREHEEAFRLVFAQPKMKLRGRPSNQYKQLCHMITDAAEEEQA